MNITLSLEEEIVIKARQRAEAMGTSVNQLVREYLGLLAGASDADLNAEEFLRLSRTARGNSAGWKFDRDEIHERP